MTKPEFVDAVVKAAGLTKKDTEAIINASIETITDALKKGDNVQFIGFGTFEVRDRAARTGINPKTKEKIQIKASKAPAFKAGKKLKEQVN